MEELEITWKVANDASSTNQKITNEEQNCVGRCNFLDIMLRKKRMRIFLKQCPWVEKRPWKRSAKWI